MYGINKIRSLPVIIVLLSFLLMSCSATSAGGKIYIQVEPDLIDGSFTGRIYAVIAPKHDNRMPLQTNYWFSPIEIISKDVVEWTGKEPIALSRDDKHYVKAAGASEFEMQVLMRVNKRDADPFTSAGNLYSAPISLSLSDVNNLGQKLMIDRVIDDSSALMKKQPAESEQLKLVSHKSQLLSDFHNEDYFVNVAVRLPKEHAVTDKTWPVLYYISGMGGNELELLRLVSGKEEYFDQFITVSVDAMNFGGHSVFANSANTGQWASLIVDEIVPLIDKPYTGAGA